MIGEVWRERLDDPGDLSNVHVYQHTYCSVGWDELHSVRHLRARTRDNTLCVCAFDEDRPDEHGNVSITVQAKCTGAEIPAPVCDPSHGR